jgi:hypothetical protein
MFPLHRRAASHHALGQRQPRGLCPPVTDLLGRRPPSRGSLGPGVGNEQDGSGTSAPYIAVTASSYAIRTLLPRSRLTVRATRRSLSQMSSSLLFGVVAPPRFLSDSEFEVECGQSVKELLDCSCLVARFEQSDRITIHSCAFRQVCLCPPRALSCGPDCATERLGRSERRQTVARCWHILTLVTWMLDVKIHSHRPSGSRCEHTPT